ncbi:hypothetical protein Tco_0440528, partial [Tanacetum coccineum]
LDGEGSPAMDEREVEEPAAKSANGETIAAAVPAESPSLRRVPAGSIAAVVVTVESVTGAPNEPLVEHGTISRIHSYQQKQSIQ